MDEKTLFFFAKKPESLPLYEQLEHRIQSEIQDVSVKVQKTQISFYNRRLFACVSFTKVRTAPQQPRHGLTLTFGLGRRLDSPRIDAATEPYSNRWTHHVFLSDAAEIDGELMAWLQEASAFSAGKR